jgi:4-nitrophenyl phosphatase
MNIQTFKTLLIDGDGVLWQADEPMPELPRFFDVVKSYQIEWGLLTNNATRTTESYVEKLRGFGVAASPSQIFTSGNVTARYLHDIDPPVRSVYVIGQPDLKKTLEQASFSLYDGDEAPAQVDAVVAGVDRTFTYAKLRVAMRLIRSGAVYVATNPDTTFPTPQGLVPGAGSIIAAVTAAAGHEPVWMGKPEPTMYQVAMKHFGADMATTAILGDRLETDILGGQRLGMGTILVLSGVTSREDLDASTLQPDFVFQDVAALANELEKCRV